MAEEQADNNQVQFADLPDDAWGLSTRAELQAKVDEAIAPLIALHYNQNHFTVAAINNCGFIVNSFLKLIRRVTSIKETEELKAVMGLGFGKFWNNQEDCTVQNMSSFCKWLKTKEGRAKLEGIAARRKIEKKATATISATDVSRIRMANAQIDMFAAEIKAVREKTEAKLVKLRRKIKLLEREPDSVG